MVKLVSNRTKFILGRVLHVVAVALIIPWLIMTIHIANNGSDIWWNIQAVPINGTIVDKQIVAYRYSEKCNTNCIGACDMCMTSSYNAYITVRYLEYEYRYLLHAKSNCTLDTVTEDLKRYQIGTTIMLYYNSKHPRDVSTTFHVIDRDIVVFIMALSAFVAVAMFGLRACRPHLKEIPKEDNVELGNNNDLYTAEYTAVSKDNNIIELQPLYLSTKGSY